jgi:hypothetical protein
MTRPLACPLSPDLVQLIADQRLDGLLTWTRSGLHHAMHAEHSPDLNAPWHACTAERRGAAPGYQPTTVTPRSGKVTFDVPQVYDGRLYPQVLEPRLQNACARGRWPPFSEKGGIATHSTAPPDGSAVVCRDQMEPESAKRHHGMAVVRAVSTDQPDGTTTPAERATQGTAYGRRGNGYVCGAFRPAIGDAYTHP